MLDLKWYHTGICGMWSARPLLIVWVSSFDSLKNVIPVNMEHWRRPPAASRAVPKAVSMREQRRRVGVAQQFVLHVLSKPTVVHGSGPDLDSTSGRLCP